MNTRNRLINFRVTDEEFRRLKNASTLQKARCLSDFARTAVLETARACEPVPDSAESVAGQLQAFDYRLTRLESHFTRLFGTTPEGQSLAIESNCVSVPPGNMKSEG